MEQHDAEMAQVTIILQAEWAEKIKEALQQLQAAGLTVTDIDDQNGVVDGDIETGKIQSLKKLPCVETTRVDFDYMAEYPQGDPRHPDPDADEDPR